MSLRSPPGLPQCPYRSIRLPYRKVHFRCRSPAAANQTEGRALVRIHSLLSLYAVAAFLLLAGGATTQAADNPLVAKGEYLARAGDCIACHTNPGSALFAGGRPMATPFGTI